MTTHPTHEPELIKRTWERYRVLARFRGHGDIFRAPLFTPMPTAWDNAPPQVVEVPHLTFLYERGGRDGERVYWVTCEGVEVESGARP